MKKRNKVLIFGTVFLFVWLLSAPFSFAQEDSLRVKRHRPYGVVNRQYSSLNYISIRVGAGLQKNPYSEVGVAFQMRNFGCTGSFSRSYYTALEFTPNFQMNEGQSRSVYALKAGIEANAFFALALEAKYQTDFSKNAFVVTPKIGLGMFGDVLLYYGYNFSTRRNKERVFPFISNHQFSLIFNIHEDFLQTR